MYRPLQYTLPLANQISCHSQGSALAMEAATDLPDIVLILG